MVLHRQDHPDAPEGYVVVDIPSDEEVERLWKTYWLPKLMKGSEGVDDATAVSMGIFAEMKAILYEYYWLVQNARKVYKHVTGGITEDLTVSHEGIIAAAEHYTEKRMRLAGSRTD